MVLTVQLRPASRLTKKSPRRKTDRFFIEAFLYPPSEWFELLPPLYNHLLFINSQIIFLTDFKEMQ